MMASQLTTLLQTYVITFGWKLLGAVALWMVGAMFIRVARAGTKRMLQLRHIDTTLAGYIDASLATVLRIVLLIAVFGVLGVETTSFAALLAALGLAVGAAWAGLLGNVAAGLFLLFLRPFRIGDVISAGGITGAVREIGIFTTTVDTGDNVRVYIGNSKVFSDSIQNFSVNPHRRVELSIQIAHGVRWEEVRQRLLDGIIRIPHVLAEPEPEVDIRAFNERGMILAVRSSCHNDHYGQVYFDTNRVIADVMSAYPVPETVHVVRGIPAGLGADVMGA
jgi:small conductance mechanosensitive channel